MPCWWGILVLLFLGGSARVQSVDVQEWLVEQLFQNVNFDMVIKESDQYSVHWMNSSRIFTIPSDASTSVLGISWRLNEFTVPVRHKKIWPDVWPLIHASSTQDDACLKPRCVGGMQDILVCGEIGLPVARWAQIQNVVWTTGSSAIGYYNNTLQTVILFTNSDSTPDIPEFLEFTKQPVFCPWAKEYCT